jgi:hypothetical protein
MDIFKDIKEEQQRDHALYFIEDGEKGFSPEYNKMVIEKTMKKARAMRLQRQKEYTEAIGERSDAVATYFKSRLAEGYTPIEKYFGKKNMAYLRGEKILQVLKKRSFLGGKERKVYLPGN